MVSLLITLPELMDLPDYHSAAVSVDLSRTIGTEATRGSGHLAERLHHGALFLGTSGDMMGWWNPPLQGHNLGAFTFGLL